MAHQNIDKFFKVSAILFGQQFVDAFGLNYNIIRLYRNELNSLNGKNYFTDLVFETREGILLNFEFQDVKIKKNDLKRYMECRIRLGDCSPALSQEPYVSLSRHTAQIDIYLK